MQRRIPDIAAAMLPFGDTVRGVAVQDADPALWLETLREVADEGFDAIDLTDSWLKPGDLSEARLTDLSDALVQANLRPVAISSIRHSVIDPDTGAENLSYTHRTIDAAATLGIDLVSIGFHRPLLPRQRRNLWFWTVDGPHDRDDVETRSQATVALRDLCKHAASVGVQVSLEMYEDTLLGSPASAVRVLTDAGMDNLGLNPDLGNLFRLHRPIDPFLESLAVCLPYTNYWHVKSYYRDEDPATGAVTTFPAPMESGSMDYRSAFRMAVDAGYSGAFCVEHYGGDGLSVAARNRDYIRHIHQTLPLKKEQR
ncbi:sugar phosphate isomerase/epimerase family protein [Herbiconiux ginsengi]|uniref:Sugar phosphate isomerase/epimerase n=1 Tax=Herbiconiux ginsengi TaxID=381665 RepID=A0A1H3U499_9MICO|nr:sugar phosphate isomerase/epimerase family protein [Herbiconiux ginsengi]SDZ56695.1 Sugar phosphate isomerase/epimerase [Herbiconiux ginsengi]